MPSTGSSFTKSMLTLVALACSGCKSAVEVRGSLPADAAVDTPVCPEVTLGFVEAFDTASSQAKDEVERLLGTTEIQVSEPVQVAVPIGRAPTCPAPADLGPLLFSVRTAFLARMASEQMGVQTSASVGCLENDRMPVFIVGFAGIGEWYRSTWWVDTHRKVQRIGFDDNRRPHSVDFERPVAHADLDGDGKRDLVIASKGKLTVRFSRGHVQSFPIEFSPDPYGDDDVGRGDAVVAPVLAEGFGVVVLGFGNEDTDVGSITGRFSWRDARFVAVSGLGESFETAYERAHERRRIARAHALDTHETYLTPWLDCLKTDPSACTEHYRSVLEYVTQAGVVPVAEAEIKLAAYRTMILCKGGSKRASP